MERDANTQSTDSTCTSKQSRGILPTNTSQPRAGGGLLVGQLGGGPYLRCPFSCTRGYPVRLSSALSAVSAVVPADAAETSAVDSADDGARLVVSGDAASLVVIVGMCQVPGQIDRSTWSPQAEAWLHCLRGWTWNGHRCVNILDSRPSSAAGICRHVECDE